MAYLAQLSVNKTIDYTPSGADVLAGDVIVQGELVGVAKVDIADGVKGALALDGIYDVVKLDTDVVAVGDKLYWDVADQELQLSATGNIYFGRAVEAAIATTTQVKVLKINV